MEIFKKINENNLLETLDILDKHEWEYSNFYKFNIDIVEEIFQKRDRFLVKKTVMFSFLSTIFNFSYKDIKNIDLSLISYQKISLFINNLTDNIFLLKDIISDIESDIIQNNIIHYFESENNEMNQIQLYNTLKLRVSKSNEKYIQSLMFYHFIGDKTSFIKILIEFIMFLYNEDEIPSVSLDLLLNFRFDENKTTLKEFVKINKLDLIDNVSPVSFHLLLMQSYLEQKIKYDSLRLITLNIQLCSLNKFGQFNELNKHLSKLSFEDKSLFFSLNPYIALSVIDIHMKEEYKHPLNLFGRIYHVSYEFENTLKASIAVFNAKVFSIVDETYISIKRKRIEDIEDIEECDVKLKMPNLSGKDKMSLIRRKSFLIAQKLIGEDDCFQEENNKQSDENKEEVYDMLMGKNVSLNSLNDDYIVFNIDENRYSIDKSIIRKNLKESCNIFYLTEDKLYDRDKINRECYTFLNLLGGSIYPVLVKVSNLVKFINSKKIINIKRTDFKCKGVITCELVRYDDISSVSRKHGTPDTAEFVYQVEDGSEEENYYYDYIPCKEAFNKRLFPDPRYASEEHLIDTLYRHALYAGNHLINPIIQEAIQQTRQVIINKIKEQKININKH